MSEMLENLSISKQKNIFKELSLEQFVEKFELTFHGDISVNFYIYLYEKLQNNNKTIILNERGLDFLKLKKILLENGYIIDYEFGKHHIAFKRKQ